MNGYKVSYTRMELGDGGWADDSTVGWRESGPFPEHVITRRGITRGNILKISFHLLGGFGPRDYFLDLKCR